MRDFIHRFYPYQALKLMLQRWRPGQRIGPSSSPPFLASPSTHSTFSARPPDTVVEPFDPIQARSQLVSYFRALKRAQTTFAAADTLPSSSVDERQLHRLRETVSRKELGFHLEVAPSQIPSAGLGLFLRHGSLSSPNTIVAMYPGTLYRPGEAIFFNSIQNRYILKCNDGVYVDGKAKGLSGSIYRSIDKRDNYPGTVPSADTTWMIDWPTVLASSVSLASAASVSASVPNSMKSETVGQEQQQPFTGVSTAILRNPLAVGQIVNNGTRAHPPNVRYQELDLRTRDCALELQEFLPNIWYSDDWHSHDHDHDNRERAVKAREEMEGIKHDGTPDPVDWSQRSLSDLDHLRTVVLVTTRPIAQDEELYSTYIE